jgi:hypothetical protein
MLTISAVIIFVCTLQSNAKKFRYPKVNCEVFEEQYQGKEADWENDAKSEYAVNFPKQELGQTTFYTGQMQCLCTNLAKAEGKKAASEKSFAINFYEIDEEGNQK